MAATVTNSEARGTGTRCPRHAHGRTNCLARKAQPCFWERGLESTYPGHMLAQDIVTLSVEVRLAPLYLHVVVDMYSSYAFCALSASALAVEAVSLLDQQVLPFYQEQRLRLTLIQTPARAAF